MNLFLIKLTTFLKLSLFEKNFGTAFGS